MGCRASPGDRDKPAHDEAIKRMRPENGTQPDSSGRDPAVHLGARLNRPGTCWKPLGSGTMDPRDEPAGGAQAWLARIRSTCCQPISAIGRARLPCWMACSLAAVPSTTRPMMPCRMPARRNML